jgi:hypothetical protein
MRLVYLADAARIFALATTLLATPVAFVAKDFGTELEECTMMN